MTFNEQRHADDLDELRWHEYERLRMETENRLCGYKPEMEDYNVDDCSY